MLLVGAGASRWAGLPTWGELVCALAGDLPAALRRGVPRASRRFEPPQAGDQLPLEEALRILEVYRALCGEEALVRRLRRLLRVPPLDAEGLELHRLLVELASFCPAVYTTNFDDLLERAFAAAGRPSQVVAGAEDLQRWAFDRAENGRFVARYPIYKLHGTLERPETLVLCETDFQRRSELAAHPIDLRFCSDVVGRSLLLVGYGFADPNLRWIWTKLGDLAVRPRAWFLEVGESSDLDRAHARLSQVERVDLRAAAQRRPRELTDFLADLLARCRRLSPRRPPPPRPGRRRGAHDSR